MILTRFESGNVFITKDDPEMYVYPNFDSELSVLKVILTIASVIIDVQWLQKSDNYFLIPWY